MELLALDDPIFVVDLTRQALAACRTDLAGTDPRTEASVPRALPPPPEHPIRAVALLLEGKDPVLIAIAATRDVAGLDAMARLLRVAIVTGLRARALALQHGDPELRSLYLGRRLPAFIYEGLSPATGAPAELCRLLP